jgi:hypothetical protein
LFERRTYQSLISFESFRIRLILTGLAGSSAVLFRDKLLIKMREKNEKVFEIIKNDKEDTVDAHKVMHCDWVQHFKRLAISEVKSVWVDLNNTEQLNEDLLKKMQQALFFLSDKDQLSFSEISGDGLPRYIYPMSGAQVFVQPEFDCHQHFSHSANIIFNSIKRFTGEVRGHVAKSIAEDIIHKKK